MQFDQFGRRKFITLLGGAVASWPLPALAQQAARMRHIGVFLPATANDPESISEIAMLSQALQESG